MATKELDYTVYTVWELARIAGVEYPDSAESVGAQWLETVAAVAADEDWDSVHDMDQADLIRELADGCVPVYTHLRMKVLVDLCAYTEDVSDDSMYGQPLGMVALAGVALYRVAERLIRELVETLQGEDGEDK